MDKSNVVKLTSRDTIIDPLTELLRTGAEQLIYEAVVAEFWSCWLNIRNDGQRTAKQAWCATVICQPASYRRGWGR